jgi:hypothetical protein
MEVSLVPPELVDGLWPRIFPYLSHASEYTFGRYEPEDIIEFVLSGQAHLWVVLDEDDIKGVTITRFWQYPRKNCLDLVFLAGDDGFSWKDEMLSTLQSWARDSGCDVIEASGRLGLARAFKDDGYRVLWQVFELPVAEAGFGGQNG